MGAHVVFDRDREPGQRRDIVSGFQTGVGGPSLPERFFFRESDISFDLIFNLIDPREDRFGQLQRTDPLA